jgi:hypothetical protein
MNQPLFRTNVYGFRNVPDANVCSGSVGGTDVLVERMFWWDGRAYPNKCSDGEGGVVGKIILE